LLGHRDDADLLGPPSGRRAGGGHPLPHPLQVRGELLAPRFPAHGTLQTYPANRPVVDSLRYENRSGLSLVHRASWVMFAPPRCFSWAVLAARMSTPGVLGPVVHGAAGPARATAAGIARDTS